MCANCRAAEAAARRQQAPGAGRCASSVLMLYLRIEGVNITVIQQEGRSALLGA